MLVSNYATSEKQKSSLPGCTIVCYYLLEPGCDNVPDNVTDYHKTKQNQHFFLAKLVAKHICLMFELHRTIVRFSFALMCMVSFGLLKSQGSAAFVLGLDALECLEQSHEHLSFHSSIYNCKWKFRGCYKRKNQGKRHETSHA